MFIRDDESPNIVRRIFNMYLEDGKGVDAIANQIDKEGIVTPGMLKGKRNAGKHWLGSTVNYILSNPAYEGDLVQHKEETIGIYTKKRKGIEEPIVIKNAHEGIISIDTFNETQRLMERRAAGARPTPALHLFTDFIICGKCRKRYWYRSAGNRYICESYAKFGKRVCSANAIREDVLIEIIKKDLKSMVEKYNAENEIGDDIGNYLKSKMYSIKTEKDMLISKKEKYEDSKISLILSKDMKQSGNMKEYTYFNSKILSFQDKDGEMILAPRFVKRSAKNYRYDNKRQILQKKCISCGEYIDVQNLENGKFIDAHDELLIYYFDRLKNLHKFFIFLLYIT